MKKLFLHNIFIILGSLSIFYFIFLIPYGRVSFMKFWLILGLLCISYGGLSIHLKSCPLDLLPPTLSKIIKVVFTCFIVFFIGIESMIIYHGAVKEKKPCDYTIILGAGLLKDKISTTLYYRLEEGIAYFNSHPNTTLVVTGGQGADELLSEGAAMKKYLLKKGIPEDKILVEDKSTNTFENFKFSKEKIKEHSGKDIKEVALITNNFHMFRAKLIAKRQGFTPYGIPSPAHYPSKVNFYVREFFATIKTVLLDK